MSQEEEPVYSDDWGKSPQMSIMSFFYMVIRTIGVLIMIVGIFVGFQVVGVIWDLYESPKYVSQYAKDLESELHVDQFVHSVTLTWNELAQEQMDQIADAQGKEAKKLPEIESPKISIIVAWFLIVVLLFIIGRIALWMTTAGAQVALHKGDSEAVARAMVREIYQQMDNRGSI